MEVGSGSGDGDGDGYGYGDGSGYGDAEVVWPESSPLLAWHCVPKNLRFRYRHAGDRPKVEPGLTLRHPGELALCSAGLHASLDLADARRYCDGVPCRVEVWGRIRFGADKLVAEYRRVVSVGDGASGRSPRGRRAGTPPPCRSRPPRP